MWDSRGKKVVWHQSSTLNASYYNNLILPDWSVCIVICIIDLTNLNLKMNCKEQCTSIVIYWSLNAGFFHLSFNLFVNLPTRSKSLSNSEEELQKSPNLGANVEKRAE